MNINLVNSNNILFIDIKNENESSDKTLDILITYIKEHTKKRVKKTVVKRFNKSNSIVYKLDYR